MFALRSPLSMALLFLPVFAFGQVIQPKNLVISAAGAVGLLTMSSRTPGISQDGMPCGEVRFAFGYAFAPKWSIAFHYDRIGTDRHSALERLRFTTYIIEGRYRPWSSERATLECALGIGPSIASLLPAGSRLPLPGAGGAFAVSVRYLRMLSNTLGIMIALDHVNSHIGELSKDDSTNGASEGPKAALRWNSQRSSIGLFVRF